MNPTLTVLVISRAFAPDGEIGAKRVTRFCTYLPDYGIRPVVLTVQERFLVHLDKDFVPPKGIRVERTTEWTNPLHVYARLRSRIPQRCSDKNSPAEDHSIGPPHRNSRRGPRRHVLSLMNTPDRYQGWYFPAVRAATRLIERQPIGAILSSAPPFTSHLIARHLSKKYGIPWAADFRDGWVTNPNAAGSPQWVLGLNARMEASCVRHADLVICNTEPLRGSFVQRYPFLDEKRFVTLTNGYDDPINNPSTAKARSLAKLFLHLGTIYGRRRIDAFFQAVSQLVKNEELNPDSFGILFQGDIGPSSLADAHRYASGLVSSRRIEFRPFVDSWQESQNTLSTADVLLIFSGSPLEVPAKFYEYLKTGKPILAIAERGALTDLLELTGSGAWADPRDPEGIAQALLKALQMPSRTPEEVSRQWDAQFHFRSLTRKLAEWLRELSANNAR